MAATKPITDCPGGILSVGDMAGARHIVDRCIPMQRCCWGITAFVVAVSLHGLAARQTQHQYSVDGSGAFLLPAVPFTRVASFDNLTTGLSCAASPEAGGVRRKGACARRVQRTELLYASYLTRFGHFVQSLCYVVKPSIMADTGAGDVLVDGGSPARPKRSTLSEKQSGVDNFAR